MTAASTPVVWGAAGARRVLSEAFGFEWPADRAAAKKIRVAIRGVLDAMELHDALASNDLRWETVYPHLHVAADPHAGAEQMAAEEEAGIQARVPRRQLAGLRGEEDGAR